MSLDASLRRVAVVDEQDDVSLDKDAWHRLAAAVLEAEGVGSHLEATVRFVGADEIAELREQHYDGSATPTDVLAFPIDGLDEPTGGVVPGLLGDVVICPLVCAERAPGRPGLRLGHDGTLDADIAVHLVHGLLHLIGHDHDDDDDAETMRQREEVHLAAWFDVPELERQSR